MPCPAIYIPPKVRPAFRLVAPWSLSFRRWARPRCPLIDRYALILDRLEKQRQTCGYVHSYIDIAQYPDIPSASLLTDSVLPLYIRWLQEVCSPPDTERPVAIIAPSKKFARAIGDTVWEIPSRPRGSRGDMRAYLVRAASHVVRSADALRGATFHYALIIQADRLRRRHRRDRFTQVYRAIVPALPYAHDSALIIVGDSSLHPRRSFARAASPPDPIPPPPRAPSAPPRGPAKLLFVNLLTPPSLHSAPPFFPPLTHLKTLS